MSLDQAKIKQLRAIGHRLKPVVMFSDNGISEGSLAELERALNDHELIKVKFAFEDRNAKQDALKTVLDASQAQCIQQIGKVALLYRLATKTNKRLSNLHRPV